MASSSSASVRVVQQSCLERYTKDYVHRKIAERIELYLRNTISFKHISKHGSIILATLWANILQHEKNFPNKKFPYKKLKDSTTGTEKLILKAEDVTFTIFMKNGTLMMQGNYVYEWFVRRFRELLDNYDPEFQLTWAFQQTVVIEHPPPEEEAALGDPNTETEDYLLLRNRQHSVQETLEQRVQDDADALLEGIGNIALDQPLWGGEVLESELQTLHQGAVKDGFTYIHKLWKSLLNKWFSTDGTRIFLASPFLDADRLADVIDIFLSYRTHGDLDTFYTRIKCDEYGKGSADKVKKEAEEKFPTNTHSFIQYKIFRKLVYPIRRFHAKFIAGIKDGQAEVLVTSANFHGNHFVHHNMETVVFLRMVEAEFMEKYIEPIAAPVVATT